MTEARSIRKHVLLMGVACSYLAVSITVSAAGKDNKPTKNDVTRQTGSKSGTSKQLSLDDLIEKHEASNSASKAAGEQINWQVISSGGGSGSSTSFILAATIGQTAVGWGSSANYGLSHGFQQSFLVAGGNSCCVNRGDVNHSGGVDVSDLGYIVDYLFRGGPPPVCDENGYYAEADVNNSGGVDVSDLGYIVDYLFRGGPPPVPC